MGRVVVGRVCVNEKPKEKHSSVFVHVTYTKMQDRLRVLGGKNEEGGNCSVMKL